MPWLADIPRLNRPYGLQDYREQTQGLPIIGMVYIEVGVEAREALQEARHVAGVHARALIGAMTSAFAVGQIIGPLLVAGLVHVPGGFSWALSVSALPLLVAAYVLYMQNARAAQD